MHQTSFFHKMASQKHTHTSIHLRAIDSERDWQRKARLRGCRIRLGRTLECGHHRIEECTTSNEFNADAIHAKKIKFTDTLIPRICRRRVIWAGRIIFSSLLFTCCIPTLGFCM